MCMTRGSFSFPVTISVSSGKSVSEYTETACTCEGSFYFLQMAIVVLLPLLFLVLLYKEVFFPEVSMSITAATITGGGKWHSSTLWRLAAVSALQCLLCECVGMGVCEKKKF